MRFAIWRLNLAIRDFVSFKHCFLCKHRSLKRVSYFLIFLIRENEIFMSVNCDPLFFRFVNRARNPPLYDPQWRPCCGKIKDCQSWNWHYSDFENSGKIINQVGERQRRILLDKFCIGEFAAYHDHELTMCCGGKDLPRSYLIKQFVRMTWKRFVTSQELLEWHQEDSLTLPQSWSHFLRNRIPCHQKGINSSLLWKTRTKLLNWVETKEVLQPMLTLSEA